MKSDAPNRNRKRLAESLDRLGHERNGPRPLPGARSKFTAQSYEYQRLTIRQSGRPLDLMQNPADELVHSVCLVGASAAAG